MDFKSLIDCIRKEEVSLFIGSGFSLKAGAPSAYELVKAIKKGLKSDQYINSDSLDIVSEEYEQMHGRESLINIIREEMSFTPTDTSDHQCLTRIPHIHNIITTNYDTLLEDAYGIDNAFVIRNTQDCTNLDKNKVNIFKIHGDFQLSDNILLTKQDYTDFFANNKEPLLWNFIQTEILTKDIFFIGYSLEDPNIFEIMKKVKIAVNGETRRFFLIAPGLHSHKVKRLAEANVTYYDAKAEDFFPELFRVLDKHIKSDYNRKRISFATLSKYSNQHDLDAIGKEGRESNNVVFEPKGLSEFQINFSADKCLAERIMSNDPSLYQESRPNSLVPALKLPIEKLDDIEILINGMTISDKTDLSGLYLAPISEDIVTTLKIKEIDFLEKVKVTKYKLNDQVIITFKVEPYTLKFEFTFNNSNESLNCTCNIEPSEKFQNLSEAIKWIELLIALSENKELIISLLPTLPLRFPENTNYNTELNRVRSYYQNLKNIELLYDLDFTEYNNYSSELYNTSELLINAYNEKLISIREVGNKCSFEINGNAEEFKSRIPLKTEEFCLAMSYTDTDSIEFNNHYFKLKPKHLLITNCKMQNIEQLNQEKVRLTVKVKENSIFHIYSDKSPNEINRLMNLKSLS